MRRFSHFCLIALLPLAATGQETRVRYRIDTLAGSDRMGDGGPATAAQIGAIQGVAVDRLGNIYLSDTDYHRVRRISASGVITTVAGTGSAGYSGDGGPAAAAQLNLPYGLAADAAGNLYIADLGNQRVRKVDPNGTISTYAGTGKKASAGLDGKATLTDLMSPRNLAVDAAGVVYISEFEGHRVRKVTADGAISTVAGTGVAGFGGDGFAARSAQLGFPAGLALDRSGVLYICDSQNHRVRKVLPGGVIVTALGGAPGVSLLTPTSLAVDPYGTLFVGDRSPSVRLYTTAGGWLPAAGGAEPGFDGDGGPALKAKLSAVRDLAVDAAGSLLIADGARVRRVNQSGVIVTVAGDGYLKAIGDGGQAAAGTLLRPTGLARDAAGSLFVADTGTERVRQISAAGFLTTLAGTGRPGYDSGALVAATTPLNAPTGVAVDGYGIVLIADSGNHRIRRVWPDGLIRNVAGTEWGGTAAIGLPAEQAAMQSPRGVCADRAGNVYSVDTGNHRVLRIPSVGLVSTAAGNGAPGDAGDGGRAEFAQLNQPEACAVDEAGSLFIADTGNHRIRKVTPAGVISTVAGGAEGFAGDGGPATSARLRTPRGVAPDGAGGLLIADTGNHRIRQVAADGIIRTLAGTGAAGFAGDGGAAALALLNAPAAVVAGVGGVIYIADTGNNRIRKLTLEDLPPEPVEAPPDIEVTNAANERSGPVAPGQLVAIAGEGLGPETGVTASLDGAGTVGTLLAEVEVRFDGTPAPVFYAQASRVLAQAPYSIDGRKETSIEVRRGKQVRGLRTLAVAASAPAVFAGLLNQDGSGNSAESPAPRGSVVTFYATGEGMTDGANLAGLPPAPPLAHPRLPVSVRMQGIECEVLFAGGAPGQAGVMQVDVRAPAGFVAPGQTTLELRVGSAAAAPVPVWLK
jgi:uncharacterized protein (TIGR03437 family)